MPLRPLDPSDPIRDELLCSPAEVRPRARRPRRWTFVPVWRRPLATGALWITVLAISVGTSACRTVGQLEERETSERATEAVAWELSGETVDVERTVGSFERVAAADALSVTIRMGPVPSVHVVGDANHVERVRANATQGRLELNLDSSPRGRDGAQVAVWVTVPLLTEVQGLNAAALRIVDLDGESLRADLSSGAQLHASGRVDTFHASASSGAAIRAQRLEADDVILDGSSGALLRVWAANKVVAAVSSGASACYVGEPSVVDRDEVMPGSTFGPCSE